VCNEKTERRKKNVAAGHDGILIGEIKGEGKNGSQIEREGRQAEKNIDACGRDDGGDPAEDEIGKVKVSGYPEDQIPERGMTLIAKVVQQKLWEAEIAGEKPGLCFIVPRLMPGNREREHDEIGQPYSEITALPTQHDRKSSRWFSALFLALGVNKSRV
jgi:hypothetical protein